MLFKERNRERETEGVEREREWERERNVVFPFTEAACQLVLVKESGT